MVSEYGRDSKLDADYRESVAFCKTEEIVETCLWYLKDVDLRLEREWQAFEAFKSPTLKESLA